MGAINRTRSEQMVTSLLDKGEVAQRLDEFIKACRDYHLAPQTPLALRHVQLTAFKILYACKLKPSVYRPLIKRLLNQISNEVPSVKFGVQLGNQKIPLAKYLEHIPKADAINPARLTIDVESFSTPAEIKAYIDDHSTMISQALGKSRVAVRNPALKKRDEYIISQHKAGILIAEIAADLEESEEFGHLCRNGEATFDMVNKVIKRYGHYE